MTEAAAPGPTSCASNSGNRNYGNFGCATQQNLAAMVDNPLDLLYPREHDAGRRRAPARRCSTKYRKGDAYPSDSSS